MNGESRILAKELAPMRSRSLRSEGFYLGEVPFEVLDLMADFIEDRSCIFE